MTDQIPLKAIRTGETATALGEFSAGDVISAEYISGVTYKQGGSGSVSRVSAQKALELPSPQDYGAAGNGVTDDTAAVSNAIGASPGIGLVGDYLVASLSNDYGVPFHGEGRILKAVTGGLRQINSNADDYQNVFGQEYLYALHKKLMAGSPASMVFSGDSTTQGGAGQATSPWLVNELVLRMGLQRGHKLTATNAGHANMTTAQWVSTYLTGDLASAPDLYVVRWGINDPNYGMSIADFKTALRAGLAQCRSTRGVDQMSILLMVPNNVNDTPHSRDQKWIEQIRKVIRQAARDYMCACIDTYAIWHDANNGTGMWMDDTYGDGRSLHPMNVLNGSIMSVVSDLIFPHAFDKPSDGVYTPTVTAVANVTALSANPNWQYMRVGNTVTLSGMVNITPTASATLTLAIVSLPVPSNFTDAAGAVGAGAAAYTPYEPCIVVARTDSGALQIGFTSRGTVSVGCYISATYRVK